MILGTFCDKRRALGRNARAAPDSEDEPDDDDDNSEGKKLVGWLYVGSHNFTPSAWGTLSGSAFNPTLNVRKLPPSFSWKDTNSSPVDHKLRAWDLAPFALARRDRQFDMLGAPAGEICRRARPAVGE